MRKREVLAFSPKEPTVGVLNRKTYRGAGYRELLELQATAQVLTTGSGDGILEVDLWDGKQLEARYFADVKTGIHYSYFPASGEWRGFNLNNTAGHVLGESVRNCGVYDGRQGWDYATDLDRETAASYIGDRKRYRWGDPILGWETDKMLERREKQYANKMRRIENMMDEAVPELPADFADWAKGHVAEEYVFQESIEHGVRCTCTACHETWVRPKGIGSSLKPCPKCGADVRGTYKKEILSVPNGRRRGKKRLILMQPCADNGLHMKKGDLPELRQRWIIRIFWIDAAWNATGKEIVMTEGIRIIVDAGKNLGNCWYLQWVRNDGSQIWNSSNPANWRYGKGYVYPGSLKETMKLWSKEQQRAGIDVLAGLGCEFDANTMIVNAKDKPAWEYMIKKGLVHLALDDINSCSTYGYSRDGGAGDINHAGKTAQDVLRLDMDRINRLRNMDGGRIAMAWLRYEQIMGLRITQETIRGYERYHFSPQSVWPLLSFVRSPAKLLHYLEKQAKKGKKSVGWMVTEYGDYLDMAKKQKLNLRSDLFLFPKDLIHAHDECVLFEKTHEIEMKAAGIREKFPDVEPVLREIREKYSYAAGAYQIIVPQKIEDIIREGRSLGHCIDTTDRYFDRISQHISYLVFLRKAEEPDRSWYTLEIEPGGTVRQQRTTGNNQNREDTEAYMPFIREWQKAVRERLTTADRDLATNSRNVRLKEYKELRDRKETVWHGALAGKLLADVLEGDLIEGVG